jgi:pyruvate kinase
MMERIIKSTEQHKMYRSLIEATQPGEEQTPPHAVATAAAVLASEIHSKAIVAYTSSGTTAARVARKRPSLPILAVTPSVDTSRRLCLLWGAHSVLAEDVHSYEAMVEQATALAMDQGFASVRDLLVVVAGIPFGHAGNTNNLRVVSIDR